MARCCLSALDRQWSFCAPLAVVPLLVTLSLGLSVTGMFAREPRVRGGDIPRVEPGGAGVEPFCKIVGEDLPAELDPAQCRGAVLDVSAASSGS